MDVKKLTSLFVVALFMMGAVFVNGSLSSGEEQQTMGEVEREVEIHVEFPGGVGGYFEEEGITEVTYRLYATKDGIKSAVDGNGLTLVGAKEEVKILPTIGENYTFVDYYCRGNGLKSALFIGNVLDEETIFVGVTPKNTEDISKYAAEWETKDVVSLQEDCYFSGTTSIEIPDGKTLDLNGYMLIVINDTMDNGVIPVFEVKGTATLIGTNGGVITAKTSATGVTVFHLYEGAILNLNGGAIFNIASSINGAVIDTVNLEQELCSNESNGATKQVNINEGFSLLSCFGSPESHENESNKGIINIVSDAALIIDGGEIIGCAVSIVSTTGYVCMEGGLISEFVTSEGVQKPIQIEGGEFKMLGGTVRNVAGSGFVVILDGTLAEFYGGTFENCSSVGEAALIIINGDVDTIFGGDPEREFVISHYRGPVAPIALYDGDCMITVNGGKFSDINSPYSVYSENITLSGNPELEKPIYGNYSGEAASITVTGVLSTLVEIKWNVSDEGEPFATLDNNYVAGVNMLTTPEDHAFCGVPDGQTVRWAVATSVIIDYDSQLASVNISELVLPVGGSINIDENKIAYGSVYVVTLTPSEGATFKGWYIGGTPVTGQVTVTDYTTLTAVMEGSGPEPEPTEPGDASVPSILAILAGMAIIAALFIAWGIKTNKR